MLLSMHKIVFLFLLIFFVCSFATEKSSEQLGSLVGYKKAVAAPGFAFYLREIIGIQSGTSKMRNASDAHDLGKINVTTHINSHNWSATNRKANRDAEVWKHYMHGVLDFWAHPINLDALIKDNPEVKCFLDPDNTLNTPLKTSTATSIKIPQGVRDLELKLPISAEAIQNRNIRFFYWLKAENVGLGLGMYAPSVIIIPKDAHGKILYSYTRYFYTQGTYPWHCYYIDRFIPPETAALYIRLTKITNQCKGTAWFTNFAWELITFDNTYTFDEQQDPHSGSLAPNIYYDHMQQHIYNIKGKKYKWNWVLGKDIGLIGQPYNISTVEGFKQYFTEQAQKSPKHMNHAIMNMKSLYYDGSRLGLIPKSMNKDWLAGLAETIVDAQDRQTGYWYNGQTLSMGVTFHITIANFCYYGLQRTDREDFIDPTALLKYLPNSDKIIAQTLRQQSSWTDALGHKRLAAWNTIAYHFTLAPDQSSKHDKADLGATWDAIFLMRVAVRFIDDSSVKDKVYESIKSAVHYIFTYNVQPDGLWLQKDTDKSVTQVDFVTSIWGDSHILERKISPLISTPKVTVQQQSDTKIKFSAQFPDGIDSVRIYAAPPGLEVEKVTESSIVGILQRTGIKFVEMDPFIGSYKTRQAMSERFGIPMEFPPETKTWSGRGYWYWKLRRINYPLPFSTNGEALTLSDNVIKGKNIYYSGCNWYGEESALCKLEINRLE